MKRSTETKMHTENITGKDLLTLGFPEGKAIGMTLEILKTNKLSNDSLTELLTDPVAFETHEIMGPIATALLAPIRESAQIIPLNENPDRFSIYGKEGIDPNAVEQLATAMKLPVTHSGALMPDAHHGYGLPIGGVLATKNAVIPFGVGVDIGCRMCMTLYPIPADYIEERREALKNILINTTRFGRATFNKPRDHEVMYDPLFKEIPLVEGLRNRAFRQLGSSGGGNHFVEFGVGEIIDENNEFGVAPGKYLAALSHSGSRGMGAKIADHYTKLAMKTCQLPQEAKHLAWLDLDTEAGQEYWLAMTLAGNYASACHHQIHDRIAIALATEPIVQIENHHNFAWKEKDAEGEEIIVHRKGATPAGKGVLGIIPGSMTAPGFIVRGKGNIASINSASHGAGRQMSRTQAKKALTKSQVSTHLQEAGVTVVGSGLDEAPMAYKDIHQVMAAQSDLVEVVGSFTPKVVRMCGEADALMRN